MHKYHNLWMILCDELTQNTQQLWNWEKLKSTKKEKTQTKKFQFKQKSNSVIIKTATTSKKVAPFENQTANAAVKI